MDSHKFVKQHYFLNENLILTLTYLNEPNFKRKIHENPYIKTTLQLNNNFCHIVAITLN